MLQPRSHPIMVKLSLRDRHTFAAQPRVLEVSERPDECDHELVISARRASSNRSSRSVWTHQHPSFARTHAKRATQAGGRVGGSC
jgi:hypothetical protein